MWNFQGSSNPSLFKRALAIPETEEVFARNIIDQSRPPPPTKGIASKIKFDNKIGRAYAVAHPWGQSNIDEDLIGQEHESDGNIRQLILAKIYRPLRANLQRDTCNHW